MCQMFSFIFALLGRLHHCAFFGVELVPIRALAAAHHVVALVACVVNLRPCVAGWAVHGDVSPSVTHLPPAFDALTGPSGNP